LNCDFLVLQIFAIEGQCFPLVIVVAYLIWAKMGLGFQQLAALLNVKKANLVQQLSKFGIPCFVQNGHHDLFTISIITAEKLILVLLYTPDIPWS